MKKVVVLSVIALFIGVGVQPAFAVEPEESHEKKKLVETSVRIHRANGIIPYTVKLTEKESDEVDRIFDNLKISLNSPVTDEEIDEIFDDAIESLYDLGMFPKMTIFEAKQLVNGKSVKSHSGNLRTGDENFNCKIAGNVTECFMYDLGRLFMGGILLNLILLLRRGLGLPWWIKFNFPLFVGRIGQISFGTSFHGPGVDWYYPSNGWIWTNGANGEITWEGWFYGNIDTITLREDKVQNVYELAYQGINEFKGIWIDGMDSFEPPYFLGNAEHVSITYY